GRADSGEARSYRPAPRDCRASFWNDQAMDEPGRLSHAWPRKSPRRVQLDGTRLQSATGTQHPWRRNNLDHANDDRAFTTASCAESQESHPNKLRRSSLPNRSRFHTVCKIYAHRIYKKYRKKKVGRS